MTTEDLTLERARACLTPRLSESHKGCYGHVLIIGGDEGMPGSVRLAAEGALRVGAGLVTVVTRAEHVSSVVSTRPELLCYGLLTPNPLFTELVEKATFIVIGPGLGRSSWSQSFFEAVYHSTKPMLIDADGLYWLAKDKGRVNPNWILTPHPGEASRLLGVSVEAIQSDRVKAIDLLQARFGGVMVLKGAQTLVASLHEPLQQCTQGNPGMASAGMGDLLSGMIAGLVAQGLSLWQAAQLGVVLHAAAGDRVATQQGMRGMLASDLLEHLPLLLR